MHQGGIKVGRVRGHQQEGGKGHRDRVAVKGAVDAVKEEVFLLKVFFEDAADAGQALGIPRAHFGDVVGDVVLADAARVEGVGSALQVIDGSDAPELRVSHGVDLAHERAYPRMAAVREHGVDAKGPELAEFVLGVARRPDGADVAEVEKDQHRLQQQNPCDQATGLLVESF